METLKQIGFGIILVILFFVIYELNVFGFYLASNYSVGTIYFLVVSIVQAFLCIALYQERKDKKDSINNPIN